MQATIAKETIHAAALIRHTSEALTQLFEGCEKQGANLLERGYAQDAAGSPCLSSDPRAVRWSAYGLYEWVLRQRFPTEPVYRYHMHNAVGTVMSNAIGLSAEALHDYRPDSTGLQRTNRGMDWLIFEAASCSDLPQVIYTAARFMDDVPVERVMEPVVGKACRQWTPKEYPEGARLVEVAPERT